MSASPKPLFTTRGWLPGGIVVNRHNEALDVAALPAFLRTLLVTDGTVTKHLEAYFWEQVVVEAQAQAVEAAAQDEPWLELLAGQDVLARRVRLRGARSRRLYAHAASLVRLDRLPARLGEELVRGAIGIGELLRERGLETYREILEVGRGADDAVYRVYRILFHGRPAILIREVFPCAPYR